MPEAPLTDYSFYVETQILSEFRHLRNGKRNYASNPDI